MVAPLYVNRATLVQIFQRLLAALCLFLDGILEALSSTLASVLEDGIDMYIVGNSLTIPEWVLATFANGTYSIYQRVCWRVITL
jgi:hypothetical protein